MPCDFVALRRTQARNLILHVLWHPARQRVLPDDDAGREYLYALLLCASLFKKARWRMHEDERRDVVVNRGAASKLPTAPLTA